MSGRQKNDLTEEFRERRKECCNHVNRHMGIVKTFVDRIKTICVESVKKLH